MNVFKIFYIVPSNLEITVPAQGQRIAVKKGYNAIRKGHYLLKIYKERIETHVKSIIQIFSKISGTYIHTYGSLLLMDHRLPVGAFDVVDILQQKYAAVPPVYIRYSLHDLCFLSL